MTTLHQSQPEPSSARADRSEAGRSRADRRRHLRRLATTAVYALVRGAAAAIGGGAVYWLLHR